MAIMPDLVKPGSRRKRWILIAVAAVIVLGGIVAAAICCWPVPSLPHSILTSISGWPRVVSACLASSYILG